MNGTSSISNLVSGLANLCQSLAATPAPAAKAAEDKAAPTSPSPLEAFKQELILKLQADYHLLQLYGLHAAKAKLPEDRSKYLHRAKNYAHRLHQRLNAIEKAHPNLMSFGSWRIRTELALSEVYGGIGDYSTEQSLLKGLLEKYFSKDASKTKALSEDEKRLFQKIHYNLEVSYYRQSTKADKADEVAEAQGDREVELLCDDYPQEEVCAAALALQVEAKTSERNAGYEQLKQAERAARRIIRDFSTSPQAHWVRETFFAGKDVPESGNYHAAFKAGVAAAAGSTKAGLSDPAMDALKGVAWLPAVLGVLTVVEWVPQTKLLGMTGKLLAIGVASGLAGGATERIVERREAMALAYNGFDAIAPKAHRKNLGDLLEIPLHALNFSGVGWGLKAGARLFWGANALRQPAAPFLFNAATGALGSVSSDYAMAKIRGEAFELNVPKAAQAALLSVPVTAVSTAPLWNRLARNPHWDNGNYIVFNPQRIWDPKIGQYVIQLESESAYVLSSGLRELSSGAAPTLTGMFLPLGQEINPAKRVGDQLQHGLWTALLPGRRANLPISGRVRKFNFEQPAANSNFYLNSPAPKASTTMPASPKAASENPQVALVPLTKNGDKVIAVNFRPDRREGAEMVAPIPRVANGDLRVGPSLSLIIAGDNEEAGPTSPFDSNGISTMPPVLSSDGSGGDDPKLIPKPTDKAVKPDSPKKEQTYHKARPIYLRGDFKSEDEVRNAIQNQIKKDRSLKGVLDLLSQNRVRSFSSWVIWSNILLPLGFALAHGKEVYEQSEVEAARDKLIKVFSTAEASKNRELTSELYSAAVEAYQNGLEALEIRHIIKDHGWKDPGNKNFNDQTLRKP